MRHRFNRSSRITSIGTVITRSQPIFDLWILRLLVNGGAWDYVDLDDSDFTFPDEGTLAPIATLIEDLRKLYDKADAAADNMDRSIRPTDRGSHVGERLNYILACGALSKHEVADLDQKLADVLTSAENAFSQKDAFSEPVAGNLKRLQKLFNLSDDTALALLFVLSAVGSRNLFYWILRCFDCTGGYSFIAALCACATGIPLETARKLFTDSDSPLHQLVNFSHAEGCSNPEDIDDWFNTDRSGLSIQRFLASPMSEDDLQSSFFKEAPTTDLTLTDFSHLPQVENTVLPYLKAAMMQKKTGVNLLIYGAPGSGKTELTRVLGQALRCRTFEIAVTAEGQDSRLDAWQAANTCLRSQNNTLLVLDEAEDVFNNGIQLSLFSRPVRSNKAKINKLLETNACPTLWLTNSLENMDPAMLRRFDIILESAAPTEPQRRAIIEKSVGEVFSPALKARLAATSKLTPGVITRVKAVVESLGLPAELRDKRGRELINDVLRVQRAGTVAPAAPMTDAVYSTEYVNTDTDLTALADGLKHHPSARICLYGVPGTGKSAYAAWLAKTLGKPLLRKKASDILNCYVGGTEARIAAAFAEATRKEAVLLIDEADSFLQDRSRSEHSWETTQVNEMLTQMESFDGIFIATTNLIDTLDAASLRRFDLKAKFDYLRPEQGLNLFRRWLEKQGIAVTDAAASRIARLDTLAPGDYATVVRQAQFHPITSADDFAERLAAECRMKDVNRGRVGAIGFA